MQTLCSIHISTWKCITISRK